MVALRRLTRTRTIENCGKATVHSRQEEALDQARVGWQLKEQYYNYYKHSTTSDCQNLSTDSMGAVTAAVEKGVADLKVRHTICCSSRIGGVSL
jgi:hypothetical protein